jgi:hypothetical protein
MRKTSSFFACASSFFLCFAAACANVVIDEQEATGGSNEGGSNEGGSNGVASSSSGAGAGGNPGFPPQSCLGGEAAIVSAWSDDGTVIATQVEEEWRLNKPGGQAVPLSFINGYDGSLATLLSDESGTVYTLTSDGLTFNEYPQNGWQPEPYAERFTAGGIALVGQVNGLTQIGYFDADAFDYSTYHPSFALQTSSAVWEEERFSVRVAGTVNEALCTVLANSSELGPVQCTGQPVQLTLNGEIGLSGPQLAHAAGTTVAFYFKPESSFVLAATQLNAEGAALSVETIEVEGLLLSAAPTADGNFIVAIASGSGLYAVRYSTQTGFGERFLVDADAPVIAPSVARGICGDDALIAYSTGAPSPELRIARIRGTQVERDTIAEGPQTGFGNVSLATRDAAF